MKLKVNGGNKEILERNLAKLFNIATVVAGGGRIPKEEDIEEAETTGRYWYRHEDEVHILGISNDNWAFIRQEHIVDDGRCFAVVEFKTRYDKVGFPKQKALSELFLHWFDFVEEV